MKTKKLRLITLILIAATMMFACTWNPEVPAVPMTAPWASMNLPVTENAVVFQSDPKEFRAVHKEDKRAVLKKYTDSLKAHAWQLGTFSEENGRFLVDMSRGSEEIHLEFYDFENTGVVIEMK